MSNNQGIIPAHIKETISLENAAVYISNLQSIQAQPGWTFLVECLRGMREEIIRQLKITPASEVSDLIVRLSAIDVMLDLPQNAIKELNLSVTEGVHDEFGYVENQHNG